MCVMLISIGAGRPEREALKEMGYRQQALYFRPLPQGQGSFRPGFNSPSLVSPRR